MQCQALIYLVWEFCLGGEWEPVQVTEWGWEKIFSDAAQSIANTAHGHLQETVKNCQGKERSAGSSGHSQAGVPPELELEERNCLLSTEGFFSSPGMNSEFNFLYLNQVSPGPI